MVSIQYVFMLQHVCFQPTTRLRKGGKEGTAGLNVPSIVMLLYVPARVGDNANVLKKKKPRDELGFTFIGCTGSGIPKTTPVTRLNMPEKTRVVESDMDPLTARVIMSGSRVPRSPNAPEISASGERRRVSTLFRWNRLMFARNAMNL